MNDELKSKAGYSPNKHGVFVDDEVKDIEFLTLPGKKVVPAAEILLLQLNNQNFISCYSLQHSTGGGAFHGLSIHSKQYPTRQAALNLQAYNILNFMKSLEKNSYNNKIIKWAEELIDEK